MPGDGLAIRHHLASTTYFGLGRQSFTARGRNQCFQAVFDERLVAARRRWRKRLSGCGGWHEVGHGGKASASGVPRQTWPTKSRAERCGCQQARHADSSTDRAHPQPRLPQHGLPVWRLLPARRPFALHVRGTQSGRPEDSSCPAPRQRCSCCESIPAPAPCASATVLDASAGPSNSRSGSAGKTRISAEGRGAVPRDCTLESRTGPAIGMARSTP
jgi:hypothetical protein